MSIPFLPGNTFTDATKTDYRKAHTLGFVNGYALQTKPLLGIGLEDLNIDEVYTPEELLAAISSDPGIAYGSKRFHSPDVIPKFVPAHVAFDKVVLKFHAYYKQTVHESVEQYLLRKVFIHYFVEDDSISIIEPPVENSGISQGVLIKRHRVPKDSTSYYTSKDFNVGINMTFYGKTFRIIDCDAFTKEYMVQTEKIQLNPTEPSPADPFQKSRMRPARNSNAGHSSSSAGRNHNDKLKSFLEFDRKVLRFYCIWDDRESMFGEKREFIIHYYLVDDSAEVREVQKPNSGRDPFPILLRRQQLPKVVADLSDFHDTPKYTWKDMTIGSVISILGRKFLIRDSDPYTRSFFQEKGMGASMAAIVIPEETGRLIEQDTPPYNGYGTVEDSLGSCKYLVLKPPKKDFIKLLENEHKVLRFVARMESKYKEDKDRRFVISYRLADDTLTIFEPPQRNAGILGGKFMERTRVLLPNSSLSDPKGPVYYEARHLFIGATLEILRRKFVILNADEYVYNYFESLPAAYPHSDREAVFNKAKYILSAGGASGLKDKLAQACAGSDDKGTGLIPRKALVEAIGATSQNQVSEHEAITLSRIFENEARLVDYHALLNL